ncbi:MAG: gamma-glutamyltransferase [Planctomycetota bacterium]
MRVSLCWIVLAPLAWAGCRSPEGFDNVDRWPTPERGAVVSEHPLATRAGLAVLESGGNAADAAVATALALAVVYPQAGNLGGGGFALFVPHDPNVAPACFDFRETAPARLVPELFHDASGAIDPRRSLETPLAVGVPGSPAGLYELQSKLGRLDFETVVEPALRLAQDGFAVDAWLERDLRNGTLRRRLEQGGADIFYPDGEPLAAGDRLRQPALARTLEALARRGPRAFYSGPVADAIAGRLADGGVLTQADLAAYRVRLRDPLRGWFAGLEVITVPPPSSGGVLLLQMLAILDGFPLDAERQRSATLESATEDGISGRALHWWIETMRRSFADRAAHLGDPDHVAVPVRDLLSARWIAERRVSIGERANPTIGPMPKPALRLDGETTHISVLDGDGNAVSLTTTLNTTFGSGLFVPEVGILLNNEIDDFALALDVANVYGLMGSEANLVGPNRRPLSSMTPAVVRDGGRVVRHVLGSPGGPRIITAVLQVLLRMEVYGQSLEEAIRAPRVHQQWSPEGTFVEPGWDADVLNWLVERGHLLVPMPPSASVQGIRVEVGGKPEAYSDPRRGGAGGIEGEGVALPATPPSGE